MSRCAADRRRRGQPARRISVSVFAVMESVRPSRGGLDCAAGRCAGRRCGRRGGRRRSFREDSSRARDQVTSSPAISTVSRSVRRYALDAVGVRKAVARSRPASPPACLDLDPGADRAPLPRHGRARAAFAAHLGRVRRRQREQRHRRRAGHVLQIPRAGAARPPTSQAGPAKSPPALPAPIVRPPRACSVQAATA